jgi:23S rRNA pseudouridine2605 synthase
MPRINQFVAQSTGMSRRDADMAVVMGRVQVNKAPAQLGQQVHETDRVDLDGRQLKGQPLQYVALHKPIGYVTSRRPQGGDPSIYQLLPKYLQHLNYVGRLDKDSSGLLLLTNDGGLAQRLGHPSSGKTKQYQVDLDRPLAPEHAAQLGRGIQLDDGPSRLAVEPQAGGRTARVSMQEGRKRQIRRSFNTLGYKVTKLHRTHIGNLALGKLQPGQHRMLTTQELL